MFINVHINITTHITTDGATENALLKFFGMS